MTGFLPLTKEEMAERGWDAPDFVCVSGDAYVDHPSFGVAIISRVIESLGFRVAMLSQPDFHSPRDFTRFGRPKYAFLITGGNIDSMVAHYTAAKRRRSDDAYTAGGKAGKRPDRAVIVYTKLAKVAYPDCPVVIGGLEASLRRFAHYDYWDDAVRPSVLLESGADLLAYGMGEHQMSEIARRLAQGQTPEMLHDIRGVCYLAKPYQLPEQHVSCASFYKVAHDKAAYARACKIQMAEQDPITGRHIVQKQDQDTILVQTPPSPPLEEEELDRVFALPFMRMYHPSYEKLGGVKAIEEVEFSIMHNRGCFGGCNFCAITLHQGRRVTARSHESVLAEARRFTRNPRFKGYIHDVGGPTANFRGPSCEKQRHAGMCTHRKCLAPTPCPNLKADHWDYLELLRELRALEGVKKVFIRSGIRYDYLNLDTESPFLDELVRYHVSGQLKVAPEHTVNRVLEKMGKPAISAFETFAKRFYEATARAKKEQYLVPYLMSSHPGCRLADAVELACFLKRHHIRPEQVQDFYPTPGTISTCMFYTGLDPMTMEEVYVPKTPLEKRRQRILLQYYKAENRREIIEVLKAAHRTDLIGTAKECLVAPDSVYLAEIARANAGKQARRTAGPAQFGRPRRNQRPTDRPSSGDGPSAKRGERSASPRTPRAGQTAHHPPHHPGKLKKSRTGKRGKR